MTSVPREVRAFAGAAAIHALLIAAATITWRVSPPPSGTGRGKIDVGVISRGNSGAPASKAASTDRSAPATVREKSASDSSPVAGAGAGTSAKAGAPGGGGAGADSFLGEIRGRIEGSLRYPISLQRRGLRGTSVLRVRIAPEGRLESAEIAESSGHAELDSLALEAAREAGPFPAGASRDPLQLLIPIEFRSNASP